MTALAIPEEWLEAIAERAAELVAAQLEGEASPWLTRAQAATYLRMPVSRLEKDASKSGRGAIPLHRDGTKVSLTETSSTAGCSRLDFRQRPPTIGFPGNAPAACETPRGRQQEVSPDASSE